MSEWKETTLADLCTDISYGYTESAKQEKVGPKFLRITDIANGRLDWDKVPYCPITDDNFKKYQLLPGDIVVARTGATTGANYTIKDNDPNDVVYASYLIRYKIDKNLANPFYIGQLLQSPNWREYIDAIAGGSAQPGANAKQLGSFEILLPPLPQQRAIASVLSSLDDKIDLLHRQNATLEKMAETLFRQWFVEEESELIPLGECIKTTSGGTPSRKRMDFYEGGNYQWVKSKELNGGYILDTEERITVEALKRSSAKLLPENSVLIAMYGATVGQFAIIGQEATCNQAICACLPNDEFPYTFIYHTIKANVDELKSRAVGSAQQNISQVLIKSLEISVNENIEKFHAEVDPMMKKIKSNYTQIRTLTALRDTLLPKLMSGEVRVKS